MKKFLTVMVSCILAVVACIGLTACSTSAKKIGAQSNTTGYLFSTYLKGCEAKAYASPALAVQDMKNGAIDYVIVDKAVANSLATNVPGLKVIDIALTQQEEFAMAVDKNQASLLASINGVLENHETEINAIVAKYLEDDTAKFVGVPAGTKDPSKADQQLVVATNAEYPPFEYTEGNLFYGADMEIAKFIADQLGLELVIVDMAFDAVVTSVGTDNIDVGIAALTVTSERAALVNFSDSYFYNTQVVVVKESETAFDECETVMDVLAILCANK